VEEDLRKNLDLPGRLEELLSWSAERWAELCRRWLLQGEGSPRVMVTGLPSKACGERIQAADKERIEAQKSKLGEEGCAAAAEKLARAEAENDVDTPDEVSKQFPLPDVAKIKLIDVSTVTTHEGSLKAVFGGDAERVRSVLEAAAGTDLPLPKMQFDHVAGAQFVTCHVLVPIDGLAPQQLALLPLWCNVAFELPLAASSAGPAMGYEAVVQALTDVTVSYSFDMGLGGDMFAVGTAGNMLDLRMKVESARYAEAPVWLGRILADAVFDIERLRVAAQRIMNAVPNVKRNSRQMMKMAMAALSYKDACAHGAFNAFRVERVLNAIVGDEASLASAAKELAGIRDLLLKAPGAMMVRVGGDVDCLGQDIIAPWRQALGSGSVVPAALAARPALPRELFATDGVRLRPGCTAGCLLSSSADESNYWLIRSESLSDPRSPDLAPLLVAAEYLTALEGPFWRKIRGAGFSYSYSLRLDLALGSLAFGLFKATDPVGAYRVAEKIVKTLCGVPVEEAEPTPKEKEKEGKEDEEEEDEGEEEEDDGLDPSALEAAQSGVIFSLIEDVDTMPGAMGQAFVRTLEHLPPDQLQFLLSAVQAVKADEVLTVLRKHVLPLFDGSKGRLAVMTCPKEKRSSIEEGLGGLVPAIKVAHFDVDALVTTLAQQSGFELLRARSMEALT